MKRATASISPAQQRVRWRARLMQFSLRFHVLLIVAATLAFALVSSHVLLAAGVEHLGLRYALVVCASYAGFCALVRLWIALIARGFPHADAMRDETNGVEIGDVGLPDVGLMRGGGARGGASWSAGGGGDFAGGGANGTFDAPVQAMARSTGSRAAGTGSDVKANVVGELLDVGTDDGAAVLVALIALLVVVAGGVLVMLWIGPGMLVEAALASFVATGAVRRSIFESPVHWLGVVLRKTAWIALLILIVSVRAGSVIERHAPGVRTAGEALIWLRTH